MKRLYYCKTHYNVDPPVDINPLILEAGKDLNIFAICARESMVRRIDKMLDRTSYFFVFPRGIWEIQDFEVDLFTNTITIVSHDIPLEIDVVAGYRQYFRKRACENLKWIRYCCPVHFQGSVQFGQKENDGSNWLIYPVAVISHLPPDRLFRLPGNTRLQSARMPVSERITKNT